MKVLVAMSGGVDSSVAAARLVAAGHHVTGVHLALNRNPDTYRSGARGCCSLEDAHDARRVADTLGIPFYVWDLSDRFHAEVVEDFVAEYADGRTPNPCLRCNERIKFAAVLDRGLALGFDAVATGHYARLENDGEARLYRAADTAKDQSYVLGVLTQQQLQHAVFPLYGSIKAEVRAESAALGLRVADKPDSHDICFIADGDTAGFLTRALGERSGDIVDQEGTVVGTHAGHHRFTIGQRKGLGLGVPAADGKPRYVLDISPVRNTVTVGPHAALAVSRIDAIRPTWAVGEPRYGRWCGQVQVRAHGVPMACTIDADAGQVQIRLSEPAFGIAPGQAAVLYDGDLVVGAATIAATEGP